MVSDGDSNVDLMLIDLNRKNAISQLLIKLETCGFQYLQQKNQLFMGHEEMKTKRINGKINASSLNPCMKPILY